MGSTTSEITMKEVKFKLHIAIDFGTDGCGLAFAYNGCVTAYDRFRGRRQRSNKTKTHILLNDDNMVSSFGNGAKFTYSELGDKQVKSWKFFERFKMALYENKLNQKNLVNVDDEKKIDLVDTAEYLKAANGAKLKSQTVFVLALKELRKLAKAFIPRITKDDIGDNEIQWILTVPAIWSEAAKDKMKQWAIKAGLVDEYIKDQCIIVYEPDCASLAIQKSHDAQAESFNPEDRYILIDAGGGTVDIACHEVMENNSVEEVVYASGGPWGSCYIDDLYMKLLEDIFSKEWMDEFNTEEPTVYVDIIDSFQQAKSTFYENSQAPIHPVQLPFEFVQFVEEKCSELNSTPEEKIKAFSKSVKYFRELFCDVDNTKNNEQKNDHEETVCTLHLVSKKDNKQYKDNEEYLEIDIKIWKCLFDSQINKTISHTEDLLKMDELKNKCKYLCLVGGFSGSPYFQEKMHNTFGEKSKYNLKLIIPSKPILAVVQGAAWMGITKNYIKARKLKYTYGIQMFFSKQTARNCGIPEDYIKNNTTNDGKVRNCFKIVAHKNERVEINEVKESIGYRLSSTSLIPILYSDHENPKTASDGEQLAVLKVPHFDDNREIITQFHFYGTIFKVYSYPKTNPNGKKTVEITYVK